MVNRLRQRQRRWSPRAWIVTDGPQPVWFVERGGVPASLTPPQVTEVSSTGSGDVLHACLLHAVFHHGASLAEALQQSLPYAAANAAHPTIAGFPLDNLPRFGGATHAPRCDVIARRAQCTRAYFRLTAIEDGTPVPRKLSDLASGQLPTAKPPPKASGKRHPIVFF